MRAHIPLAHAAVAFGSVGQLRHMAPHPVASLSAAHLADAPVPQRWVPGAQVKSHEVPLHVAALAPVGLAHPVHDVPHEFALLSIAQMPAQSCVPAGQPPQTVAIGMHAPAHSFVPAGQARTQSAPSQDTVPPVGVVHAEHEVEPQLSTSRLLTQRPPQT